jgi:precorrin isomerase
MAEEDEANGLSSVPKFDCKKESYAKWRLVFRAYAANKNFRTSLKATMAGLPSKEAMVESKKEGDSTVKEEASWAKAKKNNAAAVAAISLACQESEYALSLVMDSIDDDWPNGLAWKAILYLEEAMVDKHVTAKLQVQQDLKAVSMKEDDDPTILVEQLAEIKNKARLSRLSVTLDEQVVTVIGVAPTKYQTLLTDYLTGQVMLPTKFREMIDRMCDLQKRLQNVEDAAKLKTGKEISLTSIGTGFAGTCFTCKKKGHKASQCPQKKTSTAGKGSMPKSDTKCGHWGKAGHGEMNCWMKHPEKKPDWKKCQEAKKACNGNGNAEESACGIEVLLTDTKSLLTFSPGLAIVDDPKLFISDSGALAHLTGSAFGLYDLKDADGSRMMGSNGSMEATEKVGKLSATMCSKHGDKLFNLELSNVHCIPGPKFNLISITKAMEQCWSLGGNSKVGLYVSKGDKKIVFDVRVPTKNGIILGGYMLLICGRHKHPETYF